MNFLAQDNTENPEIQSMLIQMNLRVHKCLNFSERSLFIKTYDT